MKKNCYAMELIKRVDNFCCQIFRVSSNLIKQINYDENLGYSFIDCNKNNTHIRYVGHNQDVAFVVIIMNLLSKRAIRYEKEKRNLLKFNFSKIYPNIIYNENFIYVQYALAKWNTFYNSNVPREIVEYYEQYLNDVYQSQSYFWLYDYKTKLFKVYNLAKEDSKKYNK